MMHEGWHHGSLTKTYSITTLDSRKIQFASEPQHHNHSKKFMRRLIFLILISITNIASTTTIPPIKIDELFQMADVVAFVQVTSGEMLGTGNESCGAKYTALIQDGFKGSTKGEIIEFGNYFGYEVGSKYLLFLTKKDRTFEPMMSTNSTQMQSKNEYESRCSAWIKRNTVMHSGYGSLRIRWTSEFKFKDGIRVPTRYVVLPAGTYTVNAIPSENEEYSGLVWVKLEDMKEILQNLGK